ncbi:MAG: hypothetical protein A2624_02225 [Gammaproteobacteria bacterium RIFCSPHIGHO2_01_FULL_42_8]|nr:MAG: hypothetical protein A3B71_00690 [Gammaproteobacteria bacterium RIFCSPHIGHO2_02_FULL_42_43]OGT28277.1 MAG: hypothetical protein A2624_02225 [Gammaproteobacteria bacterium RIFCSPHIGHO2_01_FULL_42_8]OGT86547.1 MAG: hypothetical protein A3G86_08505 [Gammaproteobacteria bacterium RIFCSPLOWO2_12_FULL_42_18]
MSVRKLLVLSAAGLAAIGATAAIAGGPDHMAMPSEPGFQNSVYIDLHGGYENSNWSDFNSNNVLGPSATSNYVPTSRGKGYWTAGADMGYNITQHIAAEAGWFYQVKVSGNGTTLATNGVASQSGNSLNVHSWFAYMAARLNVALADDFDLFGKVGVGYRALSYSRTNQASGGGITGVTGNGSYWAPVFGTGVQYNWGDWMLGAQYLYFPANTDVNRTTASGVTAGAYGAPNAAPAIHTYTGFVGYKFAV